MPVTERLPKIVIKEVLPLKLPRTETRGKPLVVKDLVEFVIPNLTVTSLRTDTVKGGSDVTCQTKCTPCPTGPEYPKATCDICITPEGCPT